MCVAVASRSLIVSTLTTSILLTLLAGFQEDTFSTDSLQHIMSLLSSLDHYAFTLLTSISLSGNRSRVRDMWIFCGPPQDLPTDPGASSSDLGSPRGVAFFNITDGPAGPSQLREGMHSRAGTVPVGSNASPQVVHSRSATDPTPTTRGISPTMTHSVLKKHSAKQTSPTSPLAAPAMGAMISSSDDTESAGRGNSACSVDMTGVGTAASREHGGKRSLDNVCDVLLC